MVKCGQCGAPNTDSRVNCYHCGQQLTPIKIISSKTGNKTPWIVTGVLFFSFIIVMGANFTKQNGETPIPLPPEASNNTQTPQQIQPQYSNPESSQKSETTQQQVGVSPTQTPTTQLQKRELPPFQEAQPAPNQKNMLALWTAVVKNLRVEMLWSLDTPAEKTFLITNDDLQKMREINIDLQNGDIRAVKKNTILILQNMISVCNEYIANNESAIKRVLIPLPDASNDKQLKRQRLMRYRFENMTEQQIRDSEARLQQHETQLNEHSMRVRMEAAAKQQGFIDVFRPHGQEMAELLDYVSKLPTGN